MSLRFAARCLFHARLRPHHHCPDCDEVCYCDRGLWCQHCICGSREQPAGPQPIGIPKDVLTELVETNARLIARDPHRPECGDLDCDGCRDE